MEPNNAYVFREIGTRLYGV